MNTHTHRARLETGFAGIRGPPTRPHVPEASPSSCRRRLAAQFPRRRANHGQRGQCGVGRRNYARRRRRRCGEACWTEGREAATREIRNGGATRHARRHAHARWRENALHAAGRGRPWEARLGVGGRRVVSQTQIRPEPTSSCGRLRAQRTRRGREDDERVDEWDAGSPARATCVCGEGPHKSTDGTYAAARRVKL